MCSPLIAFSASVKIDQRLTILCYFKKSPFSLCSEQCFRFCTEVVSMLWRSSSVHDRPQWNLPSLQQCMHHILVYRVLKIPFANKPFSNGQGPEVLWDVDSSHTAFCNVRLHGLWERTHCFDWWVGHCLWIMIMFSLKLPSQNSCQYIQLSGTCTCTMRWLLLASTHVQKWAVAITLSYSLLSTLHPQVIHV